MDPAKEKFEDSVSNVSGGAPIEFYDPSKESVWTRIGLSLESFKRAPGATGTQVVAGNLTDEELQRIKADAPLLQPKMKPRHLAMIAVDPVIGVDSFHKGGSIGTGLFVGSGGALHKGGPAGILIAWILIGVMLINVTQALGEMAIVYPVSGGFYTLAHRFLDPGFAFAMGWNYVLQWLVTVPLEITVAAKTVQYWTDAIPVAALITIFWFALSTYFHEICMTLANFGVVFICLFGTLGFAEEEFWSSCLKLLVVVMFIFIGIVCICGGGPSDGEYNHYIGGLHWKDPGAFANGFKGVCAVFVTAAFSFSGTEIIGLAASETPNPRATMPGAVKGTFWRITVIYVTSLTIIGLLLPYTESRLMGGSGAGTSDHVDA
ncbi:Amino-acid permease inda1 [Paramarasmius palmivorus]|uniref:Amino-acid permease inda1 n=1 Tax=Paramarasmius palmivorus TaxID=297713 RepID=A0AAW0EEJ1_9AGAR